MVLERLMCSSFSSTVESLTCLLSVMSGQKWERQRTRESVQETKHAPSLLPTFLFLFLLSH